MEEASGQEGEERWRILSACGRLAWESGEKERAVTYQEQAVAACAKLEGKKVGRLVVEVGEGELRGVVEGMLGE